MTHPGLTALGLSDNESGTYLGNGEWSKTRDAGVLEPVNPADGEVIAKVQASSQADYDTIVERAQAAFRSEEHTSELQSLMSISYAVFCSQKKQHTTTHLHKQITTTEKTHT